MVKRIRKEYKKIKKNKVNMYIFLLFVYLEGKAFCKGIAFSVGESGPKLKEWLPVLIFSSKSESDCP